LWIKADSRGSTIDRDMPRSSLSFADQLTWTMLRHLPLIPYSVGLCFSCGSNGSLHPSECP
jgi:hypothetical protein